MIKRRVKLSIPVDEAPPVAPKPVVNAIEPGVPCSNVHISYTATVMQANPFPIVTYTGEPVIRVE